jgi:hypothetical protein
MSAVSVPAPTINSDVSKTMHRVSVIEAIKQTIQLPNKNYVET